MFYPTNYIDPDEIEFNNNGVVESISLVQFHFHWSENNYQGSEHTINGNKFAAEVRIIT